MYEHNTFLRIYKKKLFLRMCDIKLTFVFYTVFHGYNCYSLVTQVFFVKTL